MNEDRPAMGNLGGTTSVIGKEAGVTTSRRLGLENALLSCKILYNSTRDSKGMSGTTINNSGHDSSASSDDWIKGLDVTSWEDPTSLLNGAILGPQSGDDEKMAGATYKKVNSADQLSNLLLEDDNKKSAAQTKTIQDQVNQTDFPPPEAADQPRRRRSSDSRGSCKRSKRAKKGIPKRPLTAYNLYFKDRRAALMASDSRPSFEELAKVIGREWHDITPTVRHHYDRLAKVETDRYHREMDVYHENRRKERDEELHGEAIMTGAAKSAVESTLAPSMMDRMQVLPPGGEVLVHGASGLQAYRVEYKAVRMKQRDVDNGNWITLMQQTGYLKRPPS